MLKAADRDNLPRANERYSVDQFFHRLYYIKPTLSLAGEEVFEDQIFLKTDKHATYQPMGYSAIRLSINST